MTKAPKGGWPHRENNLWDGTCVYHPAPDGGLSVRAIDDNPCRRFAAPIRRSRGLAEAAVSLGASVVWEGIRSCRAVRCLASGFERTQRGPYAAARHRAQGGPQTNARGKRWVANFVR